MKYLLCATLFFVFISCRNRPVTSTPTSGELKVLCDEAIASVIETERTEFQRNYPKAKIILSLSTASDAIQQLINNDVEYIVSSRELDSNETDFLIRHDIKVYSQKFALDGVAFLVNSSNPLDELHLDQLSKILTGGYAEWRDISDAIPFKRSQKKIQIVMDSRKSGNYTLIRNLVTDHAVITASAVVISGDSINSSAPKIMDYVAANENAIGYVSTAWLGNNLEFITRLEKIKVLRLAATDMQKAVDPIPGYVYRGDYPLRRVLYVMHRQQFAGLASGFTAFITGNDGQRICLNSNLVPAINPVRLKTE
jgi:phosphate transport system substrate-binding protein